MCSYNLTFDPENQVIKSLRRERSVDQAHFLPIKHFDRGHKRFNRRPISDYPLTIASNPILQFPVFFLVNCTTIKSVTHVPGLLNPLTTDDAFWCRQFLGACYQLAQSVLKIGSALAERVGQGEVGGCTALADSAWRLLQLAVEKPWSALGGPFVCFLAQTGVENTPFTL